MYKLIAIDMDGTLLKGDKTVSERTKETIKKAKENGKYVVLCSGRPIQGLTKYLHELEMMTDDDYVISFNGALVQYSKDSRIIGKTTLKGRDYKRLYEISQQLGVNIHAFSTKGLITPKKSKYTIRESEITTMDIHIVSIDEVDDNEDIWKVMMIDEGEKLDKVVENLDPSLHEEFTIVRSTPFFLEFLNTNSNKGTGVSILADSLGIKREEIICVGDADNDRHMIEYAGLGVAVDNATKEIKDISDYITSSNEEDGVAEVIEKYML